MDTIHTPVDAILFTSASFLHVPLIVALGALLYLAYRGVTLSSQVDDLEFYKALSSRVKNQNIDLNQELDKVVLERENLKDDVKELKGNLEREHERGRASYGFIKNYLRSKVEGALGSTHPSLHERQLLDLLVESYTHLSADRDSLTKHLEMTELNEAHLTERVDELQDELTLVKVCLEEYKERDSELDEDMLGDLIEDAARDNITAFSYEIAREIHDSIVESFTRSTTHNK